MKPNQLKVLSRVYLGTDCCNDVFEYAALHPSQARIADGLVASGHLVSEWCVRCDGDGFHIEPERWGKGYQLTLAGYEALTASSPEAYPPDRRRFAAALASTKGPQ